MMTPTHVLLSASIWAHPGRRTIIAAAVAGALAPDIFMYGLFAWAKLTGVPDSELWGRIYFSGTVRSIGGASHSFIVWGAILAGGWVWRKPVIVVFALSGLLHAACDFLVHHDDAHAQFWPLTMWTFASPVSYWDPRYYGMIFAPLELASGLVLSVMMVRRFRGPGRVAFAGLVALYGVGLGAFVWFVMVAG